MMFSKLSDDLQWTSWHGAPDVLDTIAVILADIPRVAGWAAESVGKLNGQNVIT